MDGVDGKKKLIVFNVIADSQLKSADPQRILKRWVEPVKMTEEQIIGRGRA